MTVGFIYVGTFLHRFIHLTQYIAPLQADFNPGLNDTATVLVYGTGELYIEIKLFILWILNNFVIILLNQRRTSLYSGTKYIIMIMSLMGHLLSS